MPTSSYNIFYICINQHNFGRKEVGKTHVVGLLVSFRRFNQNLISLSNNRILGDLN